MNGHGTYTYASGNIYVGEFKDDKCNGKGTYTYGPKSKWAGDKYFGEFKNQKRNGQGTYTYADGSVNKGIFENGKFLYDKKPSPTVTAKKTTTYNPEDLKRLNETNSCPNCDLRSADLQGAFFYGANLEGAKLDPEGIRIAKASGAINIPAPVGIL